jgi:hypothetical protein
VSVTFKRSSLCDTGACVEVALGGRDNRVLIRNTDQPEQVARFPKQLWELFVKEIKEGQFDVE